MNSSASPESSFVTTPFAECDADFFGFSTADDYAPPGLEEIDLLGLEPLTDSPVELRDSSPSLSPKPEPEKEKKPAKKRKSWGQELPTPTTNLPPRKRAKTTAEKEQRRIERVLRNRAAAQASRERRRKELEELEDEKAILEKDNNDLKTRLSTVEEENASLAKRVEEMQRQLKSFEDSIKAFTSMGDNIVGRPAPLFQMFPDDVTLDLSSIIPTSTTSTPKPSVGSNEALGTTHQSAALMCDLQCLSVALNPQDPPAEVAAIWLLQFVLLETMASTLYSIQIPFLQLFLNLRNGTPIPTSDLMRYFPLISWLVTAKPTRQLFQRLLKCSPALALLPQDATGRAMLAQMAQSTSGQFGKGATDDDEDEGGDALNAVSECRRIVKELRSTMVMGDLRLNKMGGTRHYDSHACVFNRKPGDKEG